MDAEYEYALAVARALWGDPETWDGRMSLSPEEGALDDAGVLWRRILWRRSRPNQDKTPGAADENWSPKGVV